MVSPLFFALPLAVAFHHQCLSGIPSAPVETDTLLSLVRPPATPTVFQTSLTTLVGSYTGPEGAFTTSAEVLIPVIIPALTVGHSSSTSVSSSTGASRSSSKSASPCLSPSCFSPSPSSSPSPNPKTCTTFLCRPDLVALAILAIFLGISAITTLLICYCRLRRSKTSTTIINDPENGPRFPPGRMTGSTPPSPSPPTRAGALNGTSGHWFAGTWPVEKSETRTAAVPGSNEIRNLDTDTQFEIKDLGPQCPHLGDVRRIGTFTNSPTSSGPNSEVVSVSDCPETGPAPAVRYPSTARPRPAVPGPSSSLAPSMSPLVRKPLPVAVASSGNGSRSLTDRVQWRGGSDISSDARSAEGGPLHSPERVSTASKRSLSL
ncbi:hypothetical protein BJ875DRAFT_206003 [Amylocarpus encephaloides]|uniref:Uncharacterized protein n=1 Tax=Amylocarpus encephaloides TaxID=45428 RepID=A0A9P8C0B4_9HELO|nr:hypothetical protein BJ875DRAFT_206003 [Amylocarpus encephaloides]